MLPQIKLFLLSILTLILFSALGVMIAVVAAFGWIKVESTGMFVRWQILDSPHRFQHLMNANQDQVLAQAEDGKYYVYDSYYCDGTTGRKCEEWVEWPPDQDLNTLRNTIVEPGCKTADDTSTNDVNYNTYAKPRVLPQNEAAPRECAISLEPHPDGGVTLTYYVLFENGKVWKWIHKSIAMLYLMTIVRWAFFGLLIGIILWFRFQKF